VGFVVKMVQCSIKKQGLNGGITLTGRIKVKKAGTK